MAESRGQVDERALVAIREAMREAESWIVVRLTKSGRYQVIRLSPSECAANPRSAA